MKQGTQQDLIQKKLDPNFIEKINKNKREDERAKRLIDEWDEDLEDGKVRIKILITELTLKTGENCCALFILSFRTDLKTKGTRT